MKVTFTHKGWFGLCPVYFAGLDTNSPFVEPRHWVLSPLMRLSEAAYAVMFFAASALRPGFEAEWPLKITGLLSPAIEMDFPTETPGDAA